MDGLFNVVEIFVSEQPEIVAVHDISALKGLLEIEFDELAVGETHLENRRVIDQTIHQYLLERQRE